MNIELSGGRADKRDTNVAAKLPQLLAKAEALAEEIHAQNERRETTRREHEPQEGRWREIEQRIDRLNCNMAAWQRAEQVRAYFQAMADGLAKGGPIDPESDAAKWLRWARPHADRIDPTLKPSITHLDF